MRRVTLPLLATALAIPLLLAAGCARDEPRRTAPPVPRECRDKGDEPQQVKVDGMEAIRHCGPARATVRLDGRTTKVRGGRCQLHDGSLLVNVGTAVDDLTAPTGKRARHDYVGISVRGATPGTPYEGSGAVTVTARERMAIATMVALELRERPMRGELTATTDGSNERLSVDFTCT